MDLKVYNRSSLKPMYLVIAEDPLEEGGFSYYKCKDLVETNQLLDIRGWALSKSQSLQLRENKKIDTKKELMEINRRIPLYKIIRIENVTYKKGEQK